MTREPDRFEAKARELMDSECPHERSDEIPCVLCLAATLRREHDDALSEAAQVLHAEVTNEERYGMAQAAFSEAEDMVRALASPAAAPAAEPKPVIDVLGRATPAPPPPDGLVEALERVHGMGCGNIATHRIPAPPSEPVAPSLLPRVLAALESEAAFLHNEGKESGSRMLCDIAADLRRYIAEMEADPRNALLREAREALDTEGYCTDPAPDSLCNRIDMALADGGEG